MCLPLLHHVRLKRKTLPSVVSRVRFSLSQRRSRRFAPSSASETPAVLCLRRKTRWTWSSCLREQSAQEHTNESCTFVVPISLTLNRLTWTSDTTFFPRSSQSKMNKAPVPPPTACKAYPIAVMKMPSNTLIHTSRTRFTCFRAIGLQ